MRLPALTPPCRLPRWRVARCCFALACCLLARQGWAAPEPPPQLQATQAAVCSCSSAATSATDAATLQTALVAFVRAWDAAGQPASALAQLHSCALPEVAQHFVRGLCQAAAARWGAAAAELERAAGVAPPSWCANIRQRQALYALHQGRAEEALQRLQAAQRADPARVGTRLLTAQAYLALHQPPQAVAALRPLVCCTAVPAGPELEQARQLLEAAIAADAGRASRPETTALANLLALAQDPESGDEAAQMALALAAELPRPKVQVAAAIVALKGRHETEGRSLLRQAMAAAPLDPDPPRLLALYNVEHAGPQAALPCLTQAALRDPFNVETQRLVLDLAERQHVWTQAREALEALRRLEPARAAQHAQVEARLQQAQAQP